MACQVDFELGCYHNICCFDRLILVSNKINLKMHHIFMNLFATKIRH